MWHRDREHNLNVNKTLFVQFGITTLLNIEEIIQEREDVYNQCGIIKDEQVKLAVEVAEPLW